MVTQHRQFFGDCRQMATLADASIELVVTSPPYPMIAMWDALFISSNSRIENLLEHNPQQAFELMHQILDAVWQEVYRVLTSGGFCCINIGDATRTINGNFNLFANHARITQKLVEIGFTNLPPIIWQKPTNAPNKFMGSGMLPAGAYATYEHEYILVLRKGGKRDFSSDAAKKMRNASAFFWEERNIWFSDHWQLIGARQTLAQANRSRSAAFPLELPYRLIQMYSVYGDTVLDPFLGTGTTAIAAMISGRNSVGYEIDTSFKLYEDTNDLDAIAALGNNIVRERIERHTNFIRDRLQSKKEVKHKNVHYTFPVMTAQEQHAQFFSISEIMETEKSISVSYAPLAYSSLHSAQARFA